MRWMIALILILLAVFHFMKEPEPRPVEETFIGDQVKLLKDAENIEDQYLDAVKKAQQQMEKDLEDDTGG
ncbi:MAG: hypothetical protein HKN15_03030 [Xanthomonadales bacterium]|nr:hypothetical protein [Xanthomonadales bacterium]